MQALSTGGTDITDVNALSIDKTNKIDEQALKIDQTEFLLKNPVQLGNIDFNNQKQIQTFSQDIKKTLDDFSANTNKQSNSEEQSSIIQKLQTAKIHLDKLIDSGQITATDISNIYRLEKILTSNQGEFEDVEDFITELLEYLDYYNNRKIKTKLKGLSYAMHRQQALEAA